MGEMATRNAAADRANNGVMPRVMSGDSADDRAFDAPFGLRRRREDSAGKGGADKNCDDFHALFL